MTALVKGARPLWIILIAGCSIAMLSFGVRASMGLFKPLLTAEFNYAAYVFPFSIAIQNLIWGIMQPVAGAFADRFGSWRVMLVGGILYALGVFLMTQPFGPGFLYVSAGVLVGTGVAGTSFGLVMAAFARLVSPERRSWVMGIATAAGSLGQFLLVPMAQAMIAEFGWVAALYGLCLVLALIIPLSSLLSGGQKTTAGPVSALPLPQTFSQALREAWTHPGYIMLTLGFFACGFLLAFVTVYLPQQVQFMGLDPTWGAWALALVGLFNVVGSYMAGVLGANRPKKYLLSLNYFGRIIGVLWLMYAPPSGFSLLVFGAFMGLLWLSTVPLTNGIIAQVFGLQYLATLYGFVFLSHQIGSFVGLTLASYIEATTGSFQLMWWICIAVNAFAVVIHLPINERPVPRLTAHN